MRIMKDRYAVLLVLIWAITMAVTWEVFDLVDNTLGPAIIFGTMIPIVIAITEPRKK